MNNVTHLPKNYLNQLTKPEEAITSSLWDHWRAALRQNSEKSELLNNVLEQYLKDLAPKLGIRWLNQNKTTAKDLLVKHFDDVYKTRSKWFRRSSVILVSSLYEIMNDENELKRLYEKPKKEAAEEERSELREQARKKILSEIQTLRRNVAYDSDFNSAYRHFIKVVLLELFRSNAINPKNPRNYTTIFIYRFYYNYGLAQVAEKLSVHQGYVNSITRKLRDEFKEIFKNDMVNLCKKWEKTFHSIFNTLDDTDIEARNEKIRRLKNFQKVFIAENLAKYID